jgi:DNA-binding transcriptional regulator YiaG
MLCSCGEARISDAALERFELAVATELARTGAHSGAAIRYMRKAIGVRAEDLADLLGVRKWTVSRWETGENEAPRAAVATLGTMVFDHLAGSTMTADRLRALRRGPKLAKVVHLDLSAIPAHG